MRFGAEKRVEDFGLNRRANARAGILDLKEDHVVAMACSIVRFLARQAAARV